jgi:protease IV
MAQKRHLVIGAIIVVLFLLALGFFALMFISLAMGDGDFELLGVGGNVGVVEVFGILDESLGRTVIEDLDRWKDTRSIGAIVLHVNSPGGGVAISQEIYDAVNRAREMKPVVVSMASVAASGGYYIACPADLIVANPGTITGSIGVIMQFYTAGGLMEKIGIGQETVKSGELKDVGSLARELSGEERLMLQSVIMDTHEQFVTAIAEGRGLDEDVVRPLADGSIYSGHQAYNLGLVDTLGGLNEAVEIAAELADISGEPKVVRPYKRREVTIFDLLGGLFSGVSKAVSRPQGGPELLYLYQ